MIFHPTMTAPMKRTAARASICCLLVLLVLLLGRGMASDFNGYMVTVTAEPGKIMAGTKVLAEVPPGTRLWVFSEKPGWSEVKVPRAEEHGWLLTNSAKKEELTEQQYSDLKQVHVYLAKASEQEKAEQIAAARAILEQALALERHVLGEHPHVAITTNNVGLMAYNQGDYAAARKYYEDALAIKRSVLGNDNTGTAYTLHNLGIVANEQGEYLAARRYIDEALAIRRKVLGNDDALTAGTLATLGNLVLSQGDYLAARQYYEDALASFRKSSGNESEIAGLLNNLGLVVSDLGDHAAARRYYLEALAIYKALGNQQIHTAQAFNNLGLVARDQEDYPAARKYYEDALAIKRKILGNDHTGTAKTLCNLGLVAHDQGDYPAARKYYDEALAIEIKAFGKGNIGTALTLNNLGYLAHDQGDYLAAHKYYDETLAIRRKFLGNDHLSTAQSLWVLGLLAYVQDDLPTAADYFEQNRRIIRRHVQRMLPVLVEAEQIQFLDNAYLEGWTNHLAFGWLQHEKPGIAARSAAWLINGKAVAQESLTARALLTRDANNPQLAPLVKELTAVRQQLSVLALASPKPNEAAARQEKLAQLAGEEQRLARTLAQATGEAANEREWYELNDIRAAIPADALYVDLVRMEIRDLRKQGIKKEKPAPPRYLAWIIPAKGQGEIQILDLGEAAPIEAAIDTVRASLAEANSKNGPLYTQGAAAATKALTAQLQAVADRVLKPLAPQLADKKQLILSPDGALWLLPWAALPVAENKCLLEQCSIRYITSGRDLVKTQVSSKLGTSAPAIFANPNYNLDAQAAKSLVSTILPGVKFDELATRGSANRSSLPQVNPLPKTELEALAAQPMLAKLAGSEPEAFLADRALEAVAKNLRRPKDLLFATHGFFLPDQELKQRDDSLLASSDTRALPALTTEGKLAENPLLRCGLLLAGCNRPRNAGLDDGILTGMEIVGMDLRGTELVVLSACETGIGRVRNGEGVAGLRQAFQLAGAQSVVSTLWQVPDIDSAIIMQNFFTNLAAGQSKADALREAQLKRIATLKGKSGAAHPFYWAAWTVTGE